MIIGKDSTEGRRQSVRWGTGFVGFFILLFCILVGLLVAVVPAGVLIRLMVVPAAVCFVVLSWVLRRKNVGFPGKGVLSLLLIAVGLSVVWPRYIFFSLGGPFINPQTVSVFMSLAAIVIWIIYSPEMGAKFWSVAFSSGKIGALVFIWFSWRFVASVLGDFPLESVFDYVREFVYLSSFFIIGCAVACYEQGPKLMLRVLVVCGLIVSMLGLVEAFQEKNYFVQFAAGRDSQAVADALKTIILDKSRGGNYRAQSTFDHPIVFAQFVAAMVPLAVYFFLYEKGSGWRFFGLLLLPIGVLAIVKSGSRAGLVSLAVAFGFCVIVIWLRSITSKGFGKAFAIAGLPIFALGLGLSYFIVEELVQGRTQVEAGSSSVRLKMISDGATALSDSPLFGFGQGMALFKAGVVNTIGISTIDSYLLTIALDSGYVGLMLFFVVIATFSIKGGFAAVRLQGADGARSGLIVASILAIFATFAGLSIANNMTLLWLLIGSSLPLINKPARNLRGVS